VRRLQHQHPAAGRALRDGEQRPFESLTLATVGRRGADLLQEAPQGLGARTSWACSTSHLQTGERDRQRAQRRVVRREAGTRSTCSTTSSRAPVTQRWWSRACCHRSRRAAGGRGHRTTSTKPNQAAVLDRLVPRFVGPESVANACSRASHSEQEARMTAMDSATQERQRARGRADAAIQPGPGQSFITKEPHGHSWAAPKHSRVEMDSSTGGDGSGQWAAENWRKDTFTQVIGRRSDVRFSGGAFCRRSTTALTVTIPQVSDKPRQLVLEVAQHLGREHGTHGVDGHERRPGPRHEGQEHRRPHRHPRRPRDPRPHP